MAKTTFIVSVTRGGVDAADSVSAELDWMTIGNLDSDGNVRSSFLPGEEAVFLVNMPPGFHVVEVHVHPLCGGGYVESWNVIRDVTERLGFDSQNSEANLKYWPNTAPTVSLFTVPETILKYSLNGKTITPDKSEHLPVESEATYKISGQLVRYSPPAGLVLEDSEDVFPVRIEIEVDEL